MPRPITSKADSVIAKKTLGTDSHPGKIVQISERVNVTVWVQKSENRKKETAKAREGNSLRKLFFFILIVLALYGPLQADSFSLSLSQNMTNNLFQNRFAEKDHLSDLSFYLDKSLSMLTLFVEGKYSYLFENSNLAYYIQDAGIDTIVPLNDKSAFYFSLAGRGTFYRSDYADFNYLAVNFFAAFKSYVSQTSILKSNYSMDYKNYRDSVYDFISHSVMVSFDKYFQSKTTIKGELDWGYKYFFSPYVIEDILIIENNTDPMGGKGKGNTTRHAQYAYQNSTHTEGQGIQAFSLSGWIAQGLGSKIGLRISGMKQWVLSGQNPFFFIEEFYMVENPSYDRFSWEGYQIGSQLTLLIPWNIQLKLGYTKSQKEFPGIESLDLEGNPLGIMRKDDRKQIEVRAEKNFPRFSVFATYFYVHNSSNDLYFDWSGHFFAVGIEWNIPLGAKQ